MNTLTIILLSLLGIFLLSFTKIGKKAKENILSYINDVIDKTSDPIKKFKFKLLKLEEKIEKYSENAARAFAREITLKDRIKIYKKNINKYIKLAKEAKEAEKNNISKEHLKRALILKKQVLKLKSSLEQTTKYRKNLENALENLKLIYEIKQTDLIDYKLRFDTASANKNMKNLEGNLSLNDLETEIEEAVITKERLNELTSMNDPIKEDSFDNEELEKQFSNL